MISKTVLFFSMCVIPSAAIAGMVNFDDYGSGAIIDDEYLSMGVSFDNLRTIEVGTQGIDGASSFPYVAMPNRAGSSLFDGKSALDIAADYGIESIVYNDNTYTDVLFFVPGTGGQVAGVTDSVAVNVGFDWEAVAPGEVNQVLIEAFDSNFNLLGFTLSPTLSVDNILSIGVDFEGIRGVRISQSDGVAIDDLAFNTPVVLSVPEPNCLSLLACALSISWNSRRKRYSQSLA